MNLAQSFTMPQQHLIMFALLGGNKALPTPQDSLLQI